MKSAASIAIAVLISAGHAAAQTSPPLDWRRSDLAPNVPAATGFTSEVDGANYATIVARSQEDRPLPASSQMFRGMVFRTEIRCSERRWRILGASYYSKDYALVLESPEVAWAPLVRETPLHSAVTDVCDGGHTGPVGLKTDDPVTVQRWLDGG